jgi:hypothetical protein
MPRDDDSSHEPTIELNGQEYLVITPDGTVTVALTLAEAEAMVSLWRCRTRSTASSQALRPLQLPLRH